MSAVEPDRTKEEKEEEQTYFYSSFNSLWAKVDEVPKKDSGTDYSNNKDSIWKQGEVDHVAENSVNIKQNTMESDKTEFPHLDRINSDTNIAVAALFEIGAGTDTSQETQRSKNVNDCVVNRKDNVIVPNAPSRRLRRQWNSKMTPEEVRLAYLHRLKEEGGLGKEGINTHRKRKNELPDSKEGKSVKDTVNENPSRESADTKWSLPVNSTVDKELLDFKSDSNDSDILEGTDSSGNGNGSSNDNNTGTGSGSGSNRGHSSKNFVHRSAALSTLEKNAEVDIWRRMNLKPNDRVDTMEGNKVPFLDGHYFVSPSLSSSGNTSSHVKKSRFGERCSAEERKEKLERYRRKREERIFRKQVRYDVRKRLAESRPRVRGRFCKPSEQQVSHEEKASSEPQNDG